MAGAYVTIPGLLRGRHLLAQLQTKQSNPELQRRNGKLHQSKKTLTPHLWLLAMHLRLHLKHTSIDRVLLINPS